MMQDKQTAGMGTESPAGKAESAGLRDIKEDRENCHGVAWSLNSVGLICKMGIMSSRLV